MATLSWSTAADWDGGQSETGVHHEQPLHTHWAAADTIEKGYPSTDEGGTSLTAYVPMAEASGTTLYEIVNSNGGSYNSCTLAQTGPFGNNAVYFDGTSSYATMGTTGCDFTTPSDWTMTWWMAVHTLPSGGGNNADFFWQGKADADITGQLDATTAEVGLGLYDGSSYNVGNSGYTPTVDTWVHYAFVCDASATNQYTIYAEGTAQDTGPLNAPVSRSGVGTLGAEDGGSTRNTEMTMAHPRWYTRALSATEIQAQAEAPL